MDRRTTFNDHVLINQRLVGLMNVFEPGRREKEDYTESFQMIDLTKKRKVNEVEKLLKCDLRI